MKAHRRPPQLAARQGVLDDLSQPLHQVRFCALDLETTGCSPSADEIVEVGALRSIGGEPDGTLQVFVRPAVALPIEIEILTGIRPSVLEAAEPLPRVLPTVLEFMRGCVFVAHNARFDLAFIQAACEKLDYPKPDPVVIDTAKLARRLLHDEVRNVQLSTLAAHFRVAHTPCHRAFPDAAACLEVLWALLERAGAYGINTLPDLLEIQRPSSHPYLDKARIARDLPTGRGVYMFRNKRREVLYVGKATNLRTRVRTYFTSDERKNVRRMRSEINDVVAIETRTDLEACAIESRLIERLKPRHNRQGKQKTKPVWLKLTTELHPRWSVTRSQPSDNETWIGPFRNARAANTAAELLARTFRVRTCTQRIGVKGGSLCALYELGSCAGPCLGTEETKSDHSDALQQMKSDLRGLRATRGSVLSRLEELVAAQRFEEAAAIRDRYASLEVTVNRMRAVLELNRPRRIRLAVQGGQVDISHGQIVSDHPLANPVPPEVTGEVTGERSTIARWISANSVELVDVDGVWASAWPRAESLAATPT